MVDGFKFLYVISFYVITGTSPVATMPPKSVNLALETSILFEPQDMKQNATILSKVRQFLDKLENILYPKKISPSKVQDNEETSKQAITNFLTNIGIIVINSNNEDVQSMTAAIKDVVEESYAKNPKFHEIFKDTKVKMLMVNSAREWANTDPMLLKVEIAKNILNSKTDTSDLASFFTHLNLFFESETSLKKLTKNFAKATKTKRFSKPMTKTMTFILNEYDKMDDRYKFALHRELNKLTEYAERNLRHRVSDTADEYRRSLFNTTVKDLSESVEEELSSSGTSFENINVNNDIKINKDIQGDVTTDKGKVQKGV